MNSSIMVACVQLCCNNSEFDNVSTITDFLSEAKQLNCELVLLPEVINFIRPERMAEEIVTEGNSMSLQVIREQALRHRLWVHIGSLALKQGVRVVNRSLLVNPNGEVCARYDKLHMFTAKLNSGTYNEAEFFKAGDRSVLVRAPWGNYGMSICYDLRFPNLYQQLGRAGAEIIAVPSAFTYETGSAHWEILLRARAIETGCYVLAPAQAGSNEGREFWGHSMIVSPWGQVLSEARSGRPELITARLYANDTRQARQKLPTIWQQRKVELNTMDLVAN